MKMTVRRLAYMKEIYDKGGIIKASEWISGSGRYITKRALPPLCAEISRHDEQQHSIAVSQFFERNPKVQKVIYITDMYQATKELGLLYEQNKPA